MDLEEAKKLVGDWHVAVSYLWNQVIEKAKAGTVAVPIINEKVGGITLILSVRGIEVVLGSTGSSFVKLVDMPEFRLSDFTAVRKIVVDSVRKGHADVDKAIEDREEALDTVFVDLKKEIAEWNLVCGKGQEIKPR